MVKSLIVGATLISHPQRRVPVMQPFRVGLLLVALLALALANEEPNSPGVATPDTAAAEETSEAASAESIQVEAAAEEAAEGEDAETEPTEPLAAEATESSEGASVQFVVTQKMRTQLSELGYSQADISGLNAERAAAIISRGISKPRQGVPSDWNRGKGKPSRPAAGRSLLAAVGKQQMVAGGAVLASLLGVGFKLALGKAAPAQPLTIPVPEVEEAVLDVVDSDELWLDRQIDKLILFLKGLLGK